MRTDGGHVGNRNNSINQSINQSVSLFSQLCKSDINSTTCQHSHKLFDFDEFSVWPVVSDGSFVIKTATGSRNRARAKPPVANVFEFRFRGILQPLIEVSEQCTSGRM